MSRLQIALTMICTSFFACSDQSFHEVKEPEEYGDGSDFGLEIDPNPLDFGTLAVGCEDTQSVVLRNIGEVDLEILNFSQSDGHFALEDGPELPFWLAAGSEQRLDVGFIAPGTGTFQGRLVVEADLGMAQGAQIGDGGDISSFTDDWEIPEVHQTDIMFALDSSCSMTWDAWELYNNFDAFITELEGFSEDWRMIVANKDSGCNSSGILTPDVPDYAQRFQDALFEFNWENDYTESLLTVNEAAIQQTDAGECNSGFLRQDAMLHIIDITDEPEQSYEHTGRSWDELVDSIIDKKGSSVLTTISAIAGDVPDGCDGASAGTGYWEATEETNGVFLSICQNWSSASSLGMLAAASVNTDTFELSHVPDESSIRVTVNGNVRSTWNFDSMINAVVFTEQFPGAGDQVSISYNGAGDCG